MRRLVSLLFALALVPLLLGPAIAAWPIDAVRTTYNAGAPPAIKATDLNELQATTVGLYGGSKTVKKLAADGTGNQASTVHDGAVRAGYAVAADTVPTVQPYPGELAVGATPLCWARVAGDGTPIRVYGVDSTARAPAPPASGKYLIRCLGAPTANVVAVVTAYANAGNAVIATVDSTSTNAGITAVRVRTFTITGAPVDCEFSVLVYGA